MEAGAGSTACCPAHRRPAERCDRSRSRSSARPGGRGSPVRRRSGSPRRVGLRAGAPCRRPVDQIHHASRIRPSSSAATGSSLNVVDGSRSPTLVQFTSSLGRARAPSTACRPRSAASALARARACGSTPRPRRPPRAARGRRRARCRPRRARAPLRRRGRVRARRAARARRCCRRGWRRRGRRSACSRRRSRGASAVASSASASAASLCGIVTLAPTKPAPGRPRDRRPRTRSGGDGQRAGSASRAARARASAALCIAGERLWATGQPRTPRRASRGAQHLRRVLAAALVARLL